MRENWNETLKKPIEEGGFGVQETDKKVQVNYNGQTFELGHGDVVIAAITSCTNTSNPSVMLGAGLVGPQGGAERADRQALRENQPDPGSKVVTEYLKKSGMLESLNKLGFTLAGYGCATCIGNSGPLPEEISKAINDNDLTSPAVLSGNRNFEGRDPPRCQSQLSGFPAAGGCLRPRRHGQTSTLLKDPIGHDPDGNPVISAGHLAQQRRDPAAAAASMNADQVPGTICQCLRRQRTLEPNGGYT